jgi:hypothetical protein
VDTATNHQSLLEWLEQRGFPGLPAEPLQETISDGATVLHHPSGCVEDLDGGWRPVRTGSPTETWTCSCVFRDVLGGIAAKEFIAFTHELLDIEDALTTCLDTDPYTLGDGFPQLRRLAIRHHRQHVEAGPRNQRVLHPGSRIEACPGLTLVRDGIVGKWDAALLAHPVDETLLAEEILRYAARHLMSRVTLRATAGLRLPVMNAVQNLVWMWLGRPLTGSLQEEYYSERGDLLRSLVVDPIVGSGFTFDLLERLEAEALTMLARDTPLVCHVVGFEIRSYETREGVLPVVIGYGIRARRNSIVFGEYPQIFCEWAATVDRERHPNIVTQLSSRVRLVPVCENPGLEPHQWETAVALWEDSLENDDNDPGPYRDQATAIHAAATL